MKNTISPVLVAILLVSFGLITAAPVMAQAPSEVWVDDDFGPGTPGWNVTRFASIRHGVAAVASGGTVNVAAGTYPEQVVISKAVTLQGAGPTTVIKPSAANLTTVLTGLFWQGGTKDIASAVVANVSAGSVIIKNLRIDQSLVTSKPTGAGCLAGIFYRETGGSVHTVTIDGTGAWSGTDRAYGLYVSAAATPVSVEITGCRIANVDANAIEVMGGKVTANISHNTITGRGSINDEVQHGVNVGRDAVATVNYNVFSNLVYGPKTSWATGIMFYHYPSPTGKAATVNNNTITNCQAGVVFKNANASARGNIVNGGTVGLIGIYAEPDADGNWTASFMANAVSGMRDTGNYESAAIGINTHDAGARLEVAIEGNQLAGGGATDADGISIGVEGADGNIVATITNNTISGWDYGIRLDGSRVDAAGSSASNNSISGNDAYGLYNGGSGILNATCNWWGDPSGPHHATANPSGKGNSVSDKVLFSPWVAPPTVNTQPATQVRVRSSTLNMNYTVGSCYGPAQIRFAYTKSTSAQWTYTDWVRKTADGTHSQPLSDLDPDTTYQFRAQLRYDEALMEGSTLTFVTSPVPTVTTEAAANVTSYSAFVSMSYSGGRLGSVEVRFACKRIGDEASFYTDWGSVTGNGTYTVVLTGLAAKTKYEFKAQLRYDSTIVEGVAKQFTTAAGPDIGFYDVFCFIATAAYGTSTAQEISVLRDFRDAVLLKNDSGYRFVALYYRFSPPLADFIARSQFTRAVVRELLVDPVVSIIEATRHLWRS